MIFLSAQPDADYFVWQIEVQLMNFKKFNINKEQIHVLIAYNTESGINHRFLDLAKTYGEFAEFYFYPDQRKDKIYASTVRPNIIYQHYKQNKNLKTENIFYHDSDIVFTTKLPDFESLNSDEIWYFSDTRSYLDSDYIRARGESVLDRMCEVINIEKSVVLANDENAGGAQALIKKVQPEFWHRIEEDSRNLHALLDGVNTEIEKWNRDSDFKVTPISSWCSDMWALLWNSLKCAKVKISKDLEFCWPHFPKDDWNRMNIFHNSGVYASDQTKYFFKGGFHSISPYFTDFSHIDNSSCSPMYVQEWTELTKVIKYNALDVTFMIPIKIDGKERLDNLEGVIKFILGRFETNIIILEADKKRRIPSRMLNHNKLKYVFIEDHDKVFHRERYNNHMATISNTKIIVKYDCDVIVPPNQIYDSILSIRYGAAHLSYPYNGNFLNVAGVIRKKFLENIDVKILSRFIVPNSTYYKSVGGCALLDKETYLKNGMDNENFYGWGFEDQELFKRYQILGSKIRRVDGPLYHLDHPRGLNSYYHDDTEQINSYREYLKVSNMTKNKLVKYIKKWKWHQKER